MDKSSIIKSARGQEEEKVGFSLKLPKNLKNQLQKLSEKESISMNALIVATLQSMINDECGKELKLAKNLLLDYRNTVMKELAPYEMYEPNDPDEIMHYNDLQNTLNHINNILGV